MGAEFGERRLCGARGTSRERCLLLSGRESGRGRGGPQATACFQRLTWSHVDGWPGCSPEACLERGNGGGMAWGTRGGDRAGFCVCFGNKANPRFTDGLEGCEEHGGACGVDCKMFGLSHGQKGTVPSWGGVCGWSRPGREEDSVLLPWGPALLARSPEKSREGAASRPEELQGACPELALSRDEVF